MTKPVCQGNKKAGHGSPNLSNYCRLFSPYSTSITHVVDLLLLSSGPTNGQWCNFSPPVHAPVGFCRHLGGFREEISIFWFMSSLLWRSHSFISYSAVSDDHYISVGLTKFQGVVSFFFFFSSAQPSVTS